MDSYKRLEQEKLQIIADLSDDGVAKLIDSTIKKYYQAYIDGDKSKFNNAWFTLKEVIVMFEDEYHGLYEYINHCMCKYANLVIESGFKRDFELYAPFGVEFKSNANFNNLSASIKRSIAVKIDSVDRINIKNLHDLVSSDESVNEDIVELVNALYDSFLAKDGGADE